MEFTDFLELLKDSNISILVDDIVPVGDGITRTLALCLSVYRIKSTNRSIKSNRSMRIGGIELSENGEALEDHIFLSKIIRKISNIHNFEDTILSYFPYFILPPRILGHSSKLLSVSLDGSTILEHKEIWQRYFNNLLKITVNSYLDESNESHGVCGLKENASHSSIYTDESKEPHGVCGFKKDASNSSIYTDESNESNICKIDEEELRDPTHESVPENTESSNDRLDVQNDDSITNVNSEGKINFKDSNDTRELHTISNLRDKLNNQSHKDSKYIRKLDTTSIPNHKAYDYHPPRGILYSVYQLLFNESCFRRDLLKLDNIPNLDIFNTESALSLVTVSKFTKISNYVSKFLNEKNMYSEYLDKIHNLQNIGLSRGIKTIYTTISSRVSSPNSAIQIYNLPIYFEEKLNSNFDTHFEWYMYCIESYGYSPIDIINLIEEYRGKWYSHSSFPFLTHLNSGNKPSYYSLWMKYKNYVDQLHRLSVEINLSSSTMFSKILPSLKIADEIVKNFHKSEFDSNELTKYDVPVESTNESVYNGQQGANNNKSNEVTSNKYDVAHQSTMNAHDVETNNLDNNKSNKVLQPIYKEKTTQIANKAYIDTNNKSNGAIHKEKNLDKITGISFSNIISNINNFYSQISLLQSHHIDIILSLLSNVGFSIYYRQCLIQVLHERIDVPCEGLKYLIETGNVSQDFDEIIQSLCCEKVKIIEKIVEFDEHFQRCIEPVESVVDELWEEIVENLQM